MNFYSFQLLFNAAALCIAIGSIDLSGLQKNILTLHYNHTTSTNSENIVFASTTELFFPPPPPPQWSVFETQALLCLAF